MSSSGPKRTLAETPRARCYAAILAGAQEGLERYYQEFPERRADERGGDAVAWSLRGMHRVLVVLDGYDIRDKPTGGTVP